MVILEEDGKILFSVYCFCHLSVLGNPLRMSVTAQAKWCNSDSLPNLHLAREVYMTTELLLPPRSAYKALIIRLEYRIF